MMRNSKGWCGGIALLAATMVSTTSAYAQDVAPFDPAASNATDSGGLSIESPFLPGSGPIFGLYSTIAEDPAVFYSSNGTARPVVSHVVGSTLHGGYALGSAARVDLLIPLYPWVQATDPAFSGAALGDIRLQGTVPIVANERQFAVSIVPRLALPTGSRKAYTRRGFQVGADAAVGGETDFGFDWTVNTGLVLSGSNTLGSRNLGSSLDLGAAGVYRLDDTFRAGAELDLQLGLPGGGNRGNTSGQASVFARSQGTSGFGLTGGLGFGLFGGIGSPEYRLFGGIHYVVGQARGPIDTDADGLTDDIDQCVDEPEDVDTYEDSDGCPDLDNDADGLPDTEDSCPMAPEDPDEFQDEDGCPDSDNDADTVLDVNDGCPLEPGTPENQGCPIKDTDADGIPDDIDECPTEDGPPESFGCPDDDSDRVPNYRDECPDEAIPEDADPLQSDGCPKRVYVSAEKIVITERVYFQSGRAVIKSESYSLLDDVAAVLNQAERVKKVEIQGHTDSQGDDGFNMRLSQDRADAVRDYLVTKGNVAEGRLSAKGYGETQPVDTNRTSSGRQNNRRVEFKILIQEETMVPAETTGSKTTPPVTKPGSEESAPVTKPDSEESAPVTKPEGASPWEQ